MQRRNALRIIGCLCMMLAVNMGHAQSRVGRAGLPEGAGLAAKYPGDRGIARDPKVLFTANFETGDLKQLEARWGNMRKPENLTFSAEVPPNSPGKRSLEIAYEGHLYTPIKPADRVFVRYYIRFDPKCGYTHHLPFLIADGDPTPWPKGFAGKKPGGAELFCTAFDAWGEWGTLPPPGKWMLYSYWNEMKADGHGDYWGNNFLVPEQPPIQRGRWYCLEMMLQANSRPDLADGEQAFWVDGKLVGHFKGFRWRTTDKLKINRFWLLHDRDTHDLNNDAEHPNRVYNVWFDDLVIATDYIGPVRSKRGKMSAANAELPRLKVSKNGRSLVTEQGKPFFWLGDTAWWLPKLSQEDITLYLDDRAKQGFNLFQMDLNTYAWIPKGEPPFVNGNTDQPNEPYWQHIDWILDAAAQRKLYVALIVMWGKSYNDAFGKDLDKAYRLGAWLGARYAPRSNVLWVVSGEYDSINDYRLPLSASQKAMFHAMAWGLREGSGGKQLMTIHPGTSYTSALDFHGEPWLDFNMLQSGHEVNREAFGHPENHTLVTAAYNRSPRKPVVDGEPVYENGVDGVFITKDPNGPRMRDDAVRRKAYWAVFAGALGHTYGHADIEVFWEPGEPFLTYPNHFWKDGLQAPGASQMRHLRALIESRRPQERVPDQSLLVSDPKKGNDHVQAMRAANGSWAMVYLPTGGSVTVAMQKLRGTSVQASWFNPRDGSWRRVGVHPHQGAHTFHAPGEKGLGNDWVLTLDAMKTSRSSH